MRGAGPDTWPPAECAVLHSTSDLERDLYGAVLSPSVAEHVATCRPDPGMVVCW